MLGIKQILDWFQKSRWKSSNSLSSPEWSVIHALLRGNDPRLIKFLLQWHMANGFQRDQDVSQSECLVKWRSTPGNLSHLSLASDIESDPLVVRDSLSKRDLEFRIHVRNGGSCRPLHGKTIDGRDWPLVWQCDLVDSSERTFLTLPELADQGAGLNRLKSWMQNITLTVDFTIFVEFFEPMVPQEYDVLCKRIGIELPDDYRHLLECTNGLLIGESFIRGSDLISRTSLPGIAEDAIVVCDDIINGLSDGFYAMLTSGADSGMVVHCDMYGSVSTTRTQLSMFLTQRFDELPSYYACALEVIKEI